jgi:hypothetical protein
MELPIQRLALKEIRPDFFFCFSSKRDTSAIQASIRRSGVRTPVHVFSEGNMFRLVSGFGRYGAAAAAGFDAVPAQVLPVETPVADWFHEVILEHSSLRPFRLAEKARALRILKRCEVDPRAIEYAFCPLLDCPAQPEAIDDLLRVLDLHPAMLQYFDAYGVSLKSAKPFFRYPGDQQEILSALGTALSIRPVELLDLASGMDDLAKRSGRPTGEIARRLGIPNLLENRDLTRNEKIHRLKQALFRKRHPVVSGAHSTLEALRKKLVFPEYVRILWDPTLESPGIRIEAEIRTGQDLNRLSDGLCDASNRRSLVKMIRTV